MHSLNITAQKYFDRVQKQVKYCEYCQPYDGSELIWMLGREIQLNELLDECKVPSIHREDIASNLTCPHCGHYNFEVYDSIGKEDLDDLEKMDHLKLAQQKYGKSIKSLFKNG